MPQRAFLSVKVKTAKACTMGTTTDKIYMYAFFCSFKINCMCSVPFIVQVYFPTVYYATEVTDVLSSSITKMLYLCMELQLRSAH